MMKTTNHSEEFQQISDSLRHSLHAFAYDIEQELINVIYKPAVQQSIDLLHKKAAPAITQPELDRIDARIANADKISSTTMKAAKALLVMIDRAERINHDLRGLAHEIEMREDISKDEIKERLFHIERAAGNYVKQ